MFSFPLLSAWRKAIVLFIPTYFTALVLPIFIFWQFLIVSIVQNLSGNSPYKSLCKDNNPIGADLKS